MPTLWTIAGMDPSGCAGAMVDIEIMRGLGLYPASVITAITAQNFYQLNQIEYISAHHISAQLATLNSSGSPLAIKIGMLGTSENCDVVQHFLSHYQGHVVLDPVIQSSSGINLFVGHLKKYITSLTSLFPYIDVLTPNRLEAEQLLNRPLSSYTDIENAAHDLLHFGAKSILLKGGHMHDDLFSQDYWTNGKESFWLVNTRYPKQHYRGTGCTLSSALASCLALGYNIKDALVIASMYTHRGIRLARAIDDQINILYQGNWPENQRDLPYVSPTPLKAYPKKFLPYSLPGLYPIVDTSDWVARLLPLGVQCIQLRIKEQSNQLEKEIERSIEIAKRYQATLLINDHWELAIRHQAKAVHLGQTDIDHVAIDQLHNAGVQLGISTHCYYEVARAHTLHPSYLACGPIFPTTSKIMPFPPQGIEQLKRWRRTLDYPLVAIGGINLENLPHILETNVEGIAMISAITQADAPITRTKELLALISQRNIHDIFK